MALARGATVRPASRLLVPAVLSSALLFSASRPLAEEPIYPERSPAQVVQQIEKPEPSSSFSYSKKVFGNVVVHVARVTQIGMNRVSLYCGKPVKGIDLAISRNAKLLVNGTFFCNQDGYPLAHVMVDKKTVAVPDQRTRNLLRPCLVVNDDGSFGISSGLRVVDVIDLNCATREQLEQLFTNSELWAVNDFLRKHPGGFTSKNQLLHIGFSRSRLEELRNQIEINSSEAYVPISADELRDNEPGILHVLGGGGWLIQNGKRVSGIVRHARFNQGFTPSGGALRDPCTRTAVGVRDDSHTLILMVAERITLEDLARQMEFEGAGSAIFFDSGSSSLMVRRTWDDAHWKTVNPLPLKQGARKLPTFIVVE